MAIPFKAACSYETGLNDYLCHREYKQLLVLWERGVNVVYRKERA